MSLKISNNFYIVLNRLFVPGGLRNVGVKRFSSTDRLKPVDRRSILSVFASLIFLSLIYSCEQVDDIKIKAPKPERDLNLTIDLKSPVIHFYSDTVYQLTIEITRDSGQVLIIDEGTLIKATVGGGIKINRGGQLLVKGTQMRPVVFTSIAPGGVQGTNLKTWKGITITGKSINNGSFSANVDTSDFSCSLKYMRVEFAPLVFEAVGSKSEIENIQVSYAPELPSYQITGGTFNAKNLISYACGGAADFYITAGYSGKMQNLLALRHPYFGTAAGHPLLGQYLSGVFIENSPDLPQDQTPLTSPVISNLTVIGPQGQNGIRPLYTDTLVKSAALITANNAVFKLRNSFFAGFPRGTWCMGDDQTVVNFINKKAELGFSYFAGSDTAKAFVLDKAVTRITPDQFKKVALSASPLSLFSSGADAFYTRPFNYENLDLSPNPSSPLLRGASFEGGDFANPFFNKVSYTGALGAENWMQGWANFTPLRTDYNEPR